MFWVKYDFEYDEIRLDQRMFLRKKSRVGTVGTTSTGHQRFRLESWLTFSSLHLLLDLATYGRMGPDETPNRVTRQYTEQIIWEIWGNHWKIIWKFIGTYWENTGRSSEELGRWRCRTGKTIARVGDFPTMFDYQRVNHGSLGRFFWDKIIFFYIWGKLLNYLNLWCGSNHWGKSPLLFHCW